MISDEIRANRKALEEDPIIINMARPIALDIGDGTLSMDVFDDWGFIHASFDEYQARGGTNARTIGAPAHAIRELVKRATDVPPLVLPETVRYSMQPYQHDSLLGDLKIEGEYNGRPVVTATVLEGQETSYLFGHSSSKDIAGRRITIYGVRQHELDSGRIIRVAS